MHETSPLLHFAEDTLQIFALSFMAVVYALKVRWILRFPAARDRQAPADSGVTDARTGALWSIGAIAMPWSMESYRKHPLLYGQFAVFHLAVAASIAMSFLIPYWPHLIEGRGAVLGLQAVFAAGVLAGLLRLVRRVRSPHMRLISSPDDHFSLVLLIVWLGFSFLAAPNDRQAGEFPLLAYFFLTAFFLIYVPFSKISHYVYYPFARFYLGRTLGHRGVYPILRPAASGRRQ
jgi:nitrate reductase gamma subunit